jgi:hypothetical protein
MLWICVISTCDDVCIRRIGCDEEFVDKVDVDQLTLVSLRIRKGTCLELSASYRYWSTSVSLKKRYLKISVRAILSSYKLCEDKLFPDRYRGMEYNFRMHIITKHRYQTSHSTLLQITQQANRLMPF